MRVKGFNPHMGDRIVSLSQFKTYYQPRWNLIGTAQRDQCSCSAQGRCPVIGQRRGHIVITFRGGTRFKFLRAEVKKTLNTFAIGQVRSGDCLQHVLNARGTGQNVAIATQKTSAAGGRQRGQGVLLIP